MNLLRVASIAAVAAALLAVGVQVYFEQVANPRTIRELTDHPEGERAKKVMLLTLPSGRRIPVHYLREDDRVYAAADGSWWKERAGEMPVSVLVRGETRSGRARAVLDDDAYTERIFAKLRPDALEGFGTLIEIRLAAPETDPR